MEPTSYSAFTPSTLVKATAGQRFLAILVDALVVGIPLGVLSAIAPSLRPLLQVAALGYMVVRDTLPTFGGQSIGKKMIGIRVVKETTGASILGDYAAGLIRYVSLLIPLFNIVDACMVFSSDGKRFGDKWANTIVVKA